MAMSDITSNHSENPCQNSASNCQNISNSCQNSASSCHNCDSGCQNSSSSCQNSANSCENSTKDCVGRDANCVNGDSNCFNSSNKSPTECKTPDIYHERQSRELCALHTLNNLFQDRNAFTRKLLDDICYRLSPDNFINPHKSFFGLGNYDVNLICAAVATKNFEAIWFDRRKSPETIMTENVLGFILNIPVEYKLGFFKLPSYRKHWIGIRKIDNLYYNLDSKLERPEVIGGEQELCAYLKDHLSSPDKQVFLIVKDEVARNRTWLKPS